MRLVFGHLKRMESVVQPPREDGGYVDMTRLHMDDQQELDPEWVELILMARNKGLSNDEIRKVLCVLQENQQGMMQNSAV